MYCIACRNSVKICNILAYIDNIALLSVYFKPYFAYCDMRFVPLYQYNRVIYHYIVLCLHYYMMFYRYNGKNNECKINQIIPLCV